MVVVPALIADTTPVAAFTVATPVLDELQVPPWSPLLVKEAVVPAASEDVPLTVPAFTFGDTVNVLFDDTGLPLQANV